MTDEQYRLRRVNGANTSPTPPAESAADAAIVEDIVGKPSPSPTTILPAAGAPTQTNGNGTTPKATTNSATATAADDTDMTPSSPAPNPNPKDAIASASASNRKHDEELASLRAQLPQLQLQLSLSQKQTQEVQAALEQGRIAYAALDAKHQQFVEANVAFTHWRDDMERQRASWAEANAKFAKRHEENKAAKANLEAKYMAVVMDLEEVKERYAAVKRELARVVGGGQHELLQSPSPPLPSAIKNAGQVDASGGERGGRGKRASGMTGSSKAVRGVERGSAEHHSQHQRPGPYPTHLVEQSVLRERLTSDMFTLSQKVLEERANRAEEARQMAERRIFELESQLARHQGSVIAEQPTPTLPTPPPPPPPQHQSSSSSEPYDTRYLPDPQHQPRHHRLSSPLPPPPFPPPAPASSSPVYERHPQHPHHHHHHNAPLLHSHPGGGGGAPTLPSIRSLERDRTLPPLPRSRSRHNSSASQTNRPRHDSSASSSSRTDNLSHTNTPHLSYASATTSPSQYNYSAAAASSSLPPPPPLSGPMSGPPPPAMAPPPPPHHHHVGAGSSLRARSGSSASASYGAAGSGGVGYHPYVRPRGRGDEEPPLRRD